MRPFRQSTVVTIRIGPCLDSTGAEYTGLVIGDLTLTKNGTSAAMAAAATLTHIANGHYSLVTIAGNTDTVGSLRIDCNKATYQIPPVEGEVVEEVIYDALYAASANAFTGAAGASKVTGVVLTDTVTTYTGNTPQTGDVFPLASTEIADIKTKTDFLPSVTAGAAGGLFIAGSNAATTVNITGNLTGNVSGSVGSVTGAVGSVTAGVTLAASAIQAIWDAATSALTTVGSIGKLLVDNINATMSSRASQTSVDDLPTNAELATALGTADDAVLAQVALVKAKTDLIPAAGPASAADVNAQVLDVLNVDTFAQPGQGTPAATTTLVNMLSYVFKAFRNKHTQTTTQYALYNDDASTIDQKATCSESGGTVTRGELTTGP